MLGFLLVLVQVILFLCIIGLLVLMLKNINQRRTTADGEYVSSFQEEEPDYRDYEYEDDSDGTYDDYYEESSHEAQSAARRIKSQQYEYAEESQHYYAEMEQVQRFAEEDEAARRQAQWEADKQRFVAGAPSQTQRAPEAPVRQQHVQAETPSPAKEYEYEQPSYDEPEPPHYQPEPERPRYYNEDATANAVRPPQPRREEPPPKPKPLPPEPKGVLFDDNDDDTAPFKVKF